MDGKHLKVWGKKRKIRIARNWERKAEGEKVRSRKESEGWLRI